MKTYEEMTRSVLEKGKKCRARRKRNLLCGTSLATVLCLLLGIGLLWPEGSTAVPTQGVSVLREKESRMQIFYAGNSDPEELVGDVVTPLDLYIRVRDIRGVRTEEERLAILQEERLRNKELMATFTGPQGEKGTTCWGSENTIVSMVQNEFLYIAVTDYDQVLDMSVTTTEAGGATVVPYPYERTDQNGAVVVDTGIHVNWSLSDATIDRIDADPDMKLSEISDTVTVTVNFKDGTTEDVVIDLQLDDAGQIYVTHR